MRRQGEGSEYNRVNKIRNDQGEEMKGARKNRRMSRERVLKKQAYYDGYK